MNERFKVTYAYRDTGFFKDTISGIEYKITVTNPIITVSNVGFISPDRLVNKIVEGLNCLDNYPNPQI